MTKTGRIITATLLTIATAGLIVFAIKKTSKKIPTYAQTEYAWVSSFTKSNINNVYNFTIINEDIQSGNISANEYINGKFTISHIVTENNIQIKNQFIGFTYVYYQEKVSFTNISNQAQTQLVSIDTEQNRNCIYQIETKLTYFSKYQEDPNVYGDEYYTYTIKIQNTFHFDDYNLEEVPRLIEWEDTYTTTKTYPTDNIPTRQQTYNTNNRIFYAGELYDTLFYPNIQAINTNYQNGYNNGYQDGQTATTEDAYQQGYATGWNDSDAFNHPIALQPLMLNILTMPFTFITKAFDVTLWEGTQYAFNIANFIKGLIAIATILFIIRLFTSGFSIIGNYTGQSTRNQVNRSQVKLNKAKTEKIKKEAK